MLVYVDDMIIMGTSSTHILYILTALHNEFSLKDLGSLNYFLGIEVSHEADGSLFLSQAYIRDVLSTAGMCKAKGVKTLMVSGLKLYKDGS